MSLMSSEPNQPKFVPVLRWFSNPSRSSSAATRPSSPSLSLLSLQEALTETLPTTPPRVHLPPTFHSSRTLTRPPPFLDNLTRSTLPTASVTPQYSQNFSPLRDSPQGTLSHSPPGGSSIEWLRSVRRNINTSSASRLSPSPTLGWWFQSENKESVDALLSEDDRSDTVEQEQENIRRKCQSLSRRLSLLVITSYCRPLAKKSCGVLPRPFRL